MMNERWSPTCSLDNLRARAEILAKIRNFFAEKNVLEVETPQLSWAAGTDPNINPIRALYQGPAGKEQMLYLQTSPEYAMKRLLAAGSGAIYQLCKAYRDEDQGQYHNPEFTMLEWYRPGFDHHKLMLEVEELLRLILNCPAAEKYSYQQLFEAYLNINPHLQAAEQLRQFAHQQGIEDIPNTDVQDKDLWLQLLLTELIEPKLSVEKPVFIYDFPASQAALAQVRQEEFPVASRFEVYVRGIELANGFHELLNAKEQEQRFKYDLDKRKSLGLAPIPLDTHFLNALHHGLPDCAGVALGIDRLIMLALNSNSISEVTTFPFDRS